MSPAVSFPFDLPVFLNSCGILAVVVGGGRVGQRKARMLLETSARVRVVTPEVQPASLKHERLEWRASPYRAEHLEEARLVFTAAPLDVSQRVHADARERGIFVCRADDAPSGDFATPVTIRRGRHLSVAASTGGASPILARRIGERLSEIFDVPFGEWVSLVGFWRQQALSAVWSPPTGQTEFLERICDWEWLDQFRARGSAEVSCAYADLARDLGMATVIA